MDLNSPIPVVKNHKHHPYNYYPTLPTKPVNFILLPSLKIHHIINDYCESKFTKH